MPYIIDAIENNREMDITGDVTVNGNIGNNVTLVVTNGSVRVNGDVGNNSVINVKTKEGSVAVLSKGLFSPNNVAVRNKNLHTVEITGNVGCNSAITTDKANIKIAGHIDEKTIVYSISGNIQTLTVAANTDMSSKWGQATPINTVAEATTPADEARCYCSIQ
jgi:formylmethanofuran dehydrogenase subunit C